MSGCVSRNAPRAAAINSAAAVRDTPTRMRARPPRWRQVDVGADRLDLPKGAARATVGFLTARSQLHGTATDRPGEQLGAQYTFQRDDLVRYRRLGVPELVGATTERPKGRQSSRTRRPGRTPLT